MSHGSCTAGSSEGLRPNHTEDKAITQHGELWMRPTHVPIYVFRIDAGTPPTHGSIICKAMTEYKTEKDVTYPVQALYCESGVKLALSGIDWEH